MKQVLISILVIIVLALGIRLFTFSENPEIAAKDD